MGFNRLYGYSILPIIVNLQIVEKKFKRWGEGNLKSWTFFCLEYLQDVLNAYTIGFRFKYSIILIICLLLYQKMFFSKCDKYRNRQKYKKNPEKCLKKNPDFAVYYTTSLSLALLLSLLSVCRQNDFRVITERFGQIWGLYLYLFPKRMLFFFLHLLFICFWWFFNEFFREYHSIIM